MRFEPSTLTIVAACALAGVVVWLFDILVVFALSGVAIALLGSSWKWRATGLCFALGVAAMIPFNRGVSPSATEEALAVAGFVLLMTGLVLTFVAAGRRGVPYFLATWAAATVGFGIGGFVDSNWASRYDPLGRCFRESSSGTSATKQIWPPGVRCSGGQSEDFVGANVVDGLILLGYSASQGFLVSFPLTGLACVLLPGGRTTVTVEAGSTTTAAA